jgi:integrase
MQQLPNNCRIGKMTVYPANWKTVRADVRLTWYIKYRFYDDTLKKEKQVIIKANKYHTLKEKQESIRLLLEDEEHELLVKGLNKITGLYSVTQEDDISEYTPFVDALNYAYDKVKISHNSKLIMKSCLKYITEAAKQKHYDKQPISAIRRRHLVLLFEQVEKNKTEEAARLKKKQEPWSAHTYNSYRSYLGILYKVLENLEVVPAKMPYLLDKKEIPKKIRETLTQDERSIINEHLFSNHYPFWRCVQIFFHAGCREVELLAVKKQDVDIENNRFKVLVKKGKGGHSEEWRTIKHIVLDLWRELYDSADKGQYLFSVGLVPGSKPIRREQITRRWRTHVKTKFNITGDFYSLKHLNLDEVAKQKGLKAAQEMAGHASSAVTKLYAFGEETRAQQREHDFLKHADNKFA